MLFGSRVGIIHEKKPMNWLTYLTWIFMVLIFLMILGETVRNMFRFALGSIFCLLPPSLLLVYKLAGFLEKLSMKFERENKSKTKKYSQKSPIHKEIYFFFEKITVRFDRPRLAPNHTVLKDLSSDFFNLTILEETPNLPSLQICQDAWSKRKASTFPKR